MDFLKKLQPLWDQGKFVCVGLDSDLEKLPPHYQLTVLTGAGISAESGIPTFFATSFTSR
jgi:hypothetical protein